MGWFSNFLDRLIGEEEPDERIGGETPPVVINIPADLYYRELAVHTAVSLIANAIGRAEIRTYECGVPVKKQDYFMLNVSPNRNETSSAMWHRVISKVIRKHECLLVEADGRIYCADSFGRAAERPILGDIYENVTVGHFTFDRRFGQNDSYLLRLDDVDVKLLINGMYAHYGAILSAAAKALKQSNGQKYKLHIDGVKAGDDDFNREFEEYIKEQLKTYMESDNAVYPEFDGYKLESDPVYDGDPRSSEDFVRLRKDLFSSVAAIFHIPESMMTGNITNMDEVVGSFLTFGVNPYADMIEEALNKRAGPENFLAGNYYRVDTSRIMHKDAFNVAESASNLISSGVKSIDEVREMLGDAPLNEEWSRKHFITKNFEEIERFLSPGEGGE